MASIPAAARRRSSRVRMRAIVLIFSKRTCSYGFFVIKEIFLVLFSNLIS
jgi:hypothetical protein